MSYSTSSEEDERDQVIIPNAIVAQAKEAIEKMVPPKSRLLLYEKEYKLSYVLERSRSVKSSSLWSYFSQLKKMLLVKENIDIGRFHQVKTFLKQQCIGHRPKKSKVFTRGIASVALQQLYSLTQNGLSDPDFRCWRTRGGGPNRLGYRPRGIPTETSRRITASFTRVIDPTLQRINFTTLLGRRHPQGSHQRTGPHTGLSLAEEPESRSNSYLARKGRGEEGPRGLSEDTDGVIDQRRKKDSEDLPPARSPKDSSWISSPRPGVREVLV
ncbi:hypothetical protein MTP99_005364 [Tenebrio molitor]|nr:hypothetical protein MTP99_005364 [Tenebrio molitor]